MQTKVIQAGFTLLEMILVLSILSGLSLLAVSFVDNEDNQFRFEDTRNRLDLVRKAVLGHDNSVVNGQLLLSGYAIDNGLLPVSIDALLQKPAGYDDYSQHDPIFDAQPDSVTGINNDAGITLSNPKEKLFKGYRSGSYLQSRPGTSITFYDGWANTGIAPNYGWTVTPDPVINSLNVMSLGFDNAPGGTDYNSDIGVTVNANDWQLDVAGWEVTVSNRSNIDLAIPSPGCVRVSLLVYINDADSSKQFNWKRLTSNCLLGNGVVGISDGSCLDGIDVDSDVGGAACGTSVQVTFDAAEDNQPPTIIPAGEHIVVLTVDTDDTIHNDSSDGLCEGAGCNNLNRTTSRVLFAPRSSRPFTELVIR